MDQLIGLEKEGKVLEGCMRHGKPALLIGDTGTGKTSLVKEVAQRLDREVLRVNLDGNLTTSELVGHLHLRDNKTDFEKGLIPLSMERGLVLLLDEINACLPDVLFAIHAIMETPSRLYIPETKEEIIPKEGFTIVATMNPSNDYAGTKSLNMALYSRFSVVLRFSPLKGKALLKALSSHIPTASLESVSHVAQLIEGIFKLYEEEKIATKISIREGIAALYFSQDGLTLDEAIEVSILSKLEAYEREIVAKECVKVSVPKSVSGLSVSELLTVAEEASKLKRQAKRLQAKLDKLDVLTRAVEGFSKADGEEIVETNSE